MEIRRGERGIDGGIQGDHGRTTYHHQARSLEAEIQAEEPGWISAFSHVEGSEP